mmetsp:Transcript_4632/g.14023  ORF Transcript_4632/g.14023 Transcript_4632/m.14023 type:complete len:485 (+) Transcript_4632:1759-3213(+)
MDAKAPYLKDREARDGLGPERRVALVLRELQRELLHGLDAARRLRELPSERRRARVPQQADRHVQYARRRRFGFREDAVGPDARVERHDEVAVGVEERRGAPGHHAEAPQELGRHARVRARDVARGQRLAVRRLQHDGHEVAASNRPGPREALALALGALLHRAVRVHVERNLRAHVGERQREARREGRAAVVAAALGGFDGEFPHSNDDDGPAARGFEPLDAAGFQLSCARLVLRLVSTKGRLPGRHEAGGGEQRLPAPRRRAFGLHQRLHRIRRRERVIQEAAVRRREAPAPAARRRLARHVQDVVGRERPFYVVLARHALRRQRRRAAHERPAPHLDAVRQRPRPAVRPLRRPLAILAADDALGDEALELPVVELERPRLDLHDALAVHKVARVHADDERRGGPRAPVDGHPAAPQLLPRRFPYVPQKRRRRRRHPVELRAAERHDDAARLGRVEVARVVGVGARHGLVSTKQASHHALQV